MLNGNELEGKQYVEEEDRRGGNTGGDRGDGKIKRKGADSGTCPGYGPEKIAIEEVKEWKYMYMEKTNLSSSMEIDTFYLIIAKFLYYLFILS